jgi:hypothetical protein
VNRAELETAIARASEILGQKRVLVFGSQAILASFDFTELPSRTTLSRAADIAPEHDVSDPVEPGKARTGQRSRSAISRLRACALPASGNCFGTYPIRKPGACPVRRAEQSAAGHP